MDNLQDPTWLMWPWWVKIPNEDFTDKTLREIVVLIMEVNKVADEVTDMEIEVDWYGDDI